MNVLYERARVVLKETFGFSEFRTGQQDIVHAALSGADVVGVLPTGGGKSLCYQVPALVLPHLTLVVSPLIALMKDQTERLRLLGVPAAAVHGALSSGEINAIMSEAGRGNLRLLYVAPERLESRTFRQLLRPIPLSLLAVDEAHCISEWGHDFRPSYQSIATFFADRKRVPILALTATATPDVRQDIARSLGLTNAIEIVRGFDRPNLSLRVVRTANKIEYITDVVRRDSTLPTIVYAGSRRKVDTTAEELRKRGIGAEGYHAGMPSHLRSEVQDRFIRGSTNVLVATNAFGMGIDKANVRNVLHTDLTLTLEAYYQEAGRAGRDGLPAACTLLYQPQDRALMEFYIAGTFPEERTVADVWLYLCGRAGLGENMSTTEPVLADPTSIALGLHIPAAVVSGALGLLERSGVIARTSEGGLARIELQTSQERLQEYAATATVERKPAAEILARMLSGKPMGSVTDVHLPEILRRTGLTLNEVSSTLRSLQLARYIRYAPQGSGGGIVLTHSAVAARNLPIDWASVHKRRDHALQKLGVMVTYAETRQCKRQFILSYFGDSTVQKRCGTCSSCKELPHLKAPSERQMEMITSLIRAAWQLAGRFGRNVLADVVTGTHSERVRDRRLDRCDEWSRFRDRSRGEVLSAIDVAIDHAWLVRTADLYPVIAVSEEGASLARPLPPRLRATLAAPSSPAPPDSETYTALLALRERLALRDGVPGASLVTDAELRSIAEDLPTRMELLQPGRHGSGLFLARYGKELVDTMRDLAAFSLSVPKVRADAHTMRIASSVRRGMSLRQLAASVGLTAAATAQTLQRALEAGIELERADIVPDELYSEVYAFIRNHRFAKLRHIREHIGSDVDMAELRVAMAFARRDLFSETP